MIVFTSTDSSNETSTFLLCLKHFLHSGVRGQGFRATQTAGQHQHVVRAFGVGLTYTQIWDYDNISAALDWGGIGDSGDGDSHLKRAGLLGFDILEVYLLIGGVLGGVLGDNLRRHVAGRRRR